MLPQQQCSLGMVSFGGIQGRTTRIRATGAKSHRKPGLSRMREARFVLKVRKDEDCRLRVLGI